MIMNHERIKLWIDALRSGRYLQGKGALRKGALRSSEDEYCCLGVACDLYRQSSGNAYPDWGEAIEAEKNPLKIAIPFGDELGTMPFEVYEWFGFDNDDPILSDPWKDNPKSASLLNDSGTSFTEIANLLEALLTKGG